MPAHGIPLGHVLADSGYSHPDPAALGGPLRAAGAQRVQDLHPHDRGPRGTHDGAKALPALPLTVGLLLLGAVALRAGQGGSRLNGNVRGLVPAAGTDRDDDRFWKAGLLYVNREDPAIVVGARFGVGWTPNLGNPVAWLLIAGFVAWWAALAGLAAVAGV
jgi:hypothetical protein